MPKNAKSIQILFLFLVMLGCQKEKKTEKIRISDAQLPKTVLPKMELPENTLPKLSAAYLSQKRQQMKDFSDEIWPNNTLNGSFLVAKQGQIIYEKYQGFANKNKQTILTKDTPLHIASVSKVLTATAILKLINANRIALDQKVNTILPTLPYPNVTIKTLLNHRSGIQNYAYFTEAKGVWDRHKTLTNQDILNLMATKNIGLAFRTDTRFCYCNTNYALLALIIEKITQMPYKDAMKKMIFEPLGMKNTFVLDFENDKKNVVPSYKATNMEIGMDFLDAIYGDKNIYSTPRDLLKFDLARNGGYFLEPALLSQVYTGYSNEHKGEKNYGLGIRMINWTTGQNFYFHNGWWHGNTSSYITLQKEQVTIISLSNKFSVKTYAVRKLAPLFGDYPFISKEEKEE